MNVKQVASWILAGSAVFLAVELGQSSPVDASVEAGDSLLENRPAVLVGAVEPPPSTIERRFSGRVSAADNAMPAFTVGGRVADMQVQVGDVVEPGDIIATLESRQFRLAEQGADAGVAEVEARLAQARADLDRANELVAANAATNEEVEQRQLAVTALEASLDGAESRSDDARRLRRETTLRAPFGGVVTSIVTDEGEYAAPGVPVVEISGDGALEVEVHLPERYVAHLAAGDAASVAFPLAGLADTDATVSRVARATSAMTRLYPVTFALPTPPEGAIAGMNVEVGIQFPNDATATIPLAAVVSPAGDEAWALRVADGFVETVPFEPGEIVDGRLAVQGDLSPGDLVIIGGHAGLVDGTEVEVAQ